MLHVITDYSAHAFEQAHHLLCEAAKQKGLGQKVLIRLQ